ncbi:hypothetical protein D3C76_1786170 [compost metagenome]
MQVFPFLVKDGELGGRGGVVSLERPVTGAVDQRVGHAERRDEVVDAIVLGKSSAHVQPL